MGWTIYEICLNIFEGFVFTGFIAKMLVPNRFSKHFFWLCSLLTAAALSSYLFFPMPEWDTWTFIFIILYALLCFRGSVLQKLFWSSIPIIVSMGFVGIVYSVFSAILGYNIDQLTSPGVIRISFTITANLIFTIVLFVITRLYPNKQLSTTPSNLLLITNLLCVYLIDWFFTTQSRYALPLSWLISGCTVASLLGISTVITLHTLTKHAIQEQREKFQNQQLKESQIQMETLQETYKTTLCLRHDISSFVNDIRKYPTDFNALNRNEYLKLVEESMPAFSTGNIALDSILTVKIKKIKALGITFRGSNLHYTGGMNIDDLSLCSVVSNLLDNATEALLERKNCPGEAFIHFEFFYSPAGLMILCENPLLGVPPQMQHSAFISRKEEPYHGLGLSFLDRIANEAGGRIDVVLKDDLFRVLILIPPKKTDNVNPVQQEESDETN